MKKNVLIIAPHPDDEILGCGGTIKKMSMQGNNVWVLIVSRGKAGMYTEEGIQRVRKEALDAHKLLGVNETRFLDFPAPELDLISLSTISSAISKIINEYKADTIYIPHVGDIHHDHKVVFNASMVAARPVNNCTVKRIYAYETLSETEWAAPISSELFIPTLYIDISEVFHMKIEAFKCYKTQIREFPNPRSLKAIEALANYRGGTVGFSYAEAFMTIRIIEN
jgi:N-acetylglucosamine malate deacetylase 1